MYGIYSFFYVWFNASAIVDNCAADLVFLLERTNSISELQFEYAKQMIHDLILMQAVGPTAVNVIVISFGYNAVVEYIETASASDGARKALQLSRAADVCYPAYAFYGLNKYLAENGRPGVPKIAVIISTGTETKYEFERKEEMSLAVENGVKLNAVCECFLPVVCSVHVCACVRSCVCDEYVS